jgi:hypothetical protein
VNVSPPTSLYVLCFLTPIFSFFSHTTTLCCTNKHTHAHTHTHARTHTHTHTRARAHTHTRTRTHARTHTHTHSHSLCRSSCRFLSLKRPSRAHPPRGWHKHNSSRQRGAHQRRHWSADGLACRRSRRGKPRATLVSHCKRPRDRFSVAQCHRACTWRRGTAEQLLRAGMRLRACSCCEFKQQLISIAMTHVSCGASLCMSCN